MVTDDQSGFGSLYKVACVLLFAIGLATAFPLVAIMLLLVVPSVIGFGLPSLLVTAALLLAIGWALIHTPVHWKSMAPTSFIAPTILGLVGATLACLNILGFRPV